jgi:hypothetical protein
MRQSAETKRHKHIKMSVADAYLLYMLYYVAPLAGSNHLLYLRRPIRSRDGIYYSCRSCLK